MNLQRQSEQTGNAQVALPLVTIGIPTFKRPELLQRALACVAGQDYLNIELIVADNATPGTQVAEIVESYRKRIHNLVFKQHRENIGAYANFFALLEAAQGKYFMWLADDDEISENYVSGLVKLLERNPDASCAAGNWVTVLDLGHAWPRATRSFPQASALARSLRFIWRTDDAFFYGLHRTCALRKASFPGYFWPNKDVLMNWAYVFLLDMVLQGRVLLTEDASVRFFNYVDAQKFYSTDRGAAREVVRFWIRRCNVYWLYLRKTAGAIGPLAAPPALCVSLAALLREFVAFFLDAVFTRSKRMPTA